MTTTVEAARTFGLLRRRWPVLVLLCSLIFFVFAVLLGTYLEDRIVLLGPVDSVVLDVLLGVAAVWCVAAVLIGCLMRVARGRWTRRFVQGILAPAIMFGALGVSIIVGIVVGLLLGVDTRYKLDMPDESPKYIVSTLTLGETSLTLYRGNGIVYKRLSLSLPLPDRHTWFATNHRVETDPSGQSFLIYPQVFGGEARVLLPVD